MNYWDSEFGDDLKRAGAQRRRAKQAEATTAVPARTPAWDARFPHEVYPAADPGDRFCDCMHILDEHVADLTRGSMRCDQRNVAGKRVCKCRDFTCYEHPDNRCGNYDDEPAAAKEK